MTATFHVGDVLEVVAKLPDDSVDLVLSSPPFLALRSYLPADHPDKAKEGGSQATPGEYIDWLLDVVEACDRVLAPHGSLCFELGDTYAGSGGENNLYTSGYSGYAQGLDTKKPPGQGIPRASTGWPLPKSLSLIPETFRFAMVYGHNPLTGRQTDRWRLRNVIRWVRPNPPVGALGDKFRPATSELMVFCKSGKRFFDLDAVREASQGPKAEKREALGIDGQGRYTQRIDSNTAGAPPLDWWNIPPGGYEGAHYAVWPPELLIRPIKAMSPEQVCRTCGEPRRRIVGETDRYLEQKEKARSVGWVKPDALYTMANAKQAATVGWEDGTPISRETITLGFSDCGHDNYRPGLVLDPFAGSGTTLAVATGHGRDAIGIDLDERNYQLALERVGPLILEKA